MKVQKVNTEKFRNLIETVNSVTLNNIELLRKDPQRIFTLKLEAMEGILKQEDDFDLVCSYFCRLDIYFRFVKENKEALMFMKKVIRGEGDYDLISNEISDVLAEIEIPRTGKLSFKRFLKAIKWEMH